MAVVWGSPVRIAAIDAGSNAIRLAIAEVRPAAGLAVVETERFPVRLGHRVFLEHRLDPPTIARAAEAFRHFRRLLDRYQVKSYRAVATSAAFVWGAPWRQGEVRRVLRAIQRVALGIGLGIVVLFYFYPNALQSRLEIYEETLLPSSPKSELAFRAWTYPLENFLGAFNYPRWPYGYGIGTTALGGQYIARFFNVKPPVVGVESGFGTLVVEMGVGGLILWILMSVAILFSAWKVVKKLRGTPWFPVGFVIFWYAFFLLGPATFGGMAAYEDFLLNAYFWLLLGLLFRLPSLALSAEFAIGAPATRRSRRWIG